ncbi:hypothetical protein [Agreia sp.]|uniref:hypothetical protein n=1 Tax=Agreia sp. TaxID=1872416 RepID=UPI0035BBFF8F
MSAAAAAVALAIAVAGCSAQPTPNASGARPLTTEEAQRLAIARFTNYDEGVRSITAEVPGDPNVELAGWVDFAEHRGYAAAATDGAAVGSAGLFGFTGDTIAVREGAEDGAVLPIPADGWVTDSLDATASSLQNLFVIALSLGSDRPDNPQLLQQSDALWLRSDEIDGTPVDVIAGPTSDTPATAAASEDDATVRYWLDTDGRMLRLEVAQPSSDSWTVLDLGDHAVVDISAVATLGTTDG